MAWTSRTGAAGAAWFHPQHPDHDGGPDEGMDYLRRFAAQQPVFDRQLRRARCWIR